MTNPPDPEQLKQLTTALQLLKDRGSPVTVPNAYGGPTAVWTGLVKRINSTSERSPSGHEMAIVSLVDGDVIHVALPFEQAKQLLMVL